MGVHQSKVDLSVSFFKSALNLITWKNNENECLSEVVWTEKIEVMAQVSDFKTIKIYINNNRPL